MSDFFVGIIQDSLQVYAGTSEEVLMARTNLSLLFLHCIGFLFSYHNELDEKASQNKSIEAL